MTITNHKINKLHLKNFTCFQDISMEFCSGVNVLIGENGTGKSHILKVLYSFLLEKIKEQKGTRTFLPDSYFVYVFKNQWSSLIRQTKYINQNHYTTDVSVFIDYQYNNQSGQFQYPPSNQLSDFLKENTIPSVVYLPPTEMLSFHKGFQASYENREFDFDYTYYELSKLLSLNKLKGNKKQEADHLKKELLRLVDVDIIHKQDGFYYEYPTGLSIKATVAADGENKIAQIIHLIENGSINKNTTLIWDEPEGSLNPKWINIIAQFIVALANVGIQVIVATHDYLLTNKISLYSEHREKYQAQNLTIPEIKFFCLNKNEEDATEIVSGDNLLAIDTNPILEEFLTYYEEAERLEN